MLPGRVLPASDKKAIGRPRTAPPADAVALVRQASATGATKRGVAMVLGVNVDVLTRWLAESSELREAFEQGRETERAKLHNVLYEAATKGVGKEALIAAMFLLKARHGYVEGEKPETGSRLNVVFQIPAAMPLKEFVTIDESTRTEQFSNQPARSARRD